MRRYGLFLYLYPKSFRNEYGEEMRRVLARRRREAHGPFAVLAFWAGEFVDAISSAARAHLDILRQDLRNTARACRRAPGFFVAAVSVTALGIGATTAAFSLADHVLVRPLPFPDPDRLVKIWQADIARPATLHGLAGTNDVAPPNYFDWKTLSSSFAAMGAYAIGSSNLVGSGDPERVPGSSVTSDALTVLGVPPALGRALNATDDQAGAPCVVLLSDAFRRRKFASVESVLGLKIVLDDEPCHVVGVMPRGFEFPTRDVAFWRPIRFGPDAYTDRNNNYLRVIARLKPDGSREQATADLARVSARLAELYPADNKEVGAAVMALRDEINNQSRVLLFALAGASLCVLLIACTNLASLFLARATAHARELAVRAALGAGRERLLRQLLTESVLIAGLGGSLGVLLAVVSVPLAARLVPTSLPVAEAPVMDVRLLAIAVAATFVTVLACSVLPALRASRRADAGALRDGARAGTSRRTERVRGYLVVAQVMASVALLVGAGLLLRALWRVQGTDPGFKTDNVLTMHLNLAWPKYAPLATRVQFYNRVIEDIDALPQVAGAAFASFLPLTNRGGLWGIYLPGRSLAPGEAEQAAFIRYVTPAYFEVMRIPLKAGRTFDDRDGPRGEKTAVVSETFGRKLWPGESMVGKHIIVNRVDLTIVGVVGDVKLRGLERQSEPQFYMPFTQQPDDSYIGYTPRDLAVRATETQDGAQSAALAASIRQIVAKADPQLPISDVRSLTTIVDNDTAARSVQAYVLGGFAAIACLLAAVGLHGLLAFMVSTRTREIGVRVALGARRRDILAMILGRGLRLAVVGAGAGILVAYLAGRSVRAVLAGIDPADSTTISVAVLLSIGMTIAGSLMPAIRAARTDPMEATKAE